MSFQTWKCVSTEITHKNPIWEYRTDHIRAEDGSERDYWYVQTGGGSCVFPVTKDGKVVLVHQYRYLLNRVSLEPAGGKCEADLSFQESVEEELKQEAGISAEHVEHIGSIAPWAAVSNEEMHIFVASDLSPAFATPDEFEECDTVEMTPGEVDEAIMRGEMFNGFAIAAWTLAKPHILKIIDRNMQKR